MKLSNFVLKKTKGTGPLDWEFFADVDVTSGFLLWKRTVRREIYREYGHNWIFVDTGEYTPDTQAERLGRDWKAMTGEQA